VLIAVELCAVREEEDEKEEEEEDPDDAEVEAQVEDADEGDDGEEDDEEGEEETTPQVDPTGVVWIRLCSAISTATQVCTSPISP